MVKQGIEIRKYIFIILLCVSVPQEPFVCDIEPSAFEYTMNVIASVSIDGSLTNDEDNLLGAFSNDECRGVVTPLNFSGYDIFFLVVYSNGPNDPISFTLYKSDANINIQLNEELTFSPNLILGSVVEPYPLTGSSLLMGDLNQDGELDILDIIQLVAIILEQMQGSEYQLVVGDTNNDQALDVVDIVIIVGWIMS